MRVENRGATLYYERDGDGPAVVCVPEAGLGAWQWGWQHRALAGPADVIVHDARGTGRSSTPDEPADLRTLAGDVEAILADAGVANAHLVGLGLGGLTCLQYARSYGRAQSLTLIGTAADGRQLALDDLYAPPDDRDALRAATADCLSAAFREAQPDVVDGIVDWRSEGDAGPDGAAVQRAAADADLGDRLHEITTPATVVHGGEDAIAPVEAGRRLADSLPRGEFVAFDDAGHLVTVERSRPLNDRLAATILPVGG
ncbi:alpha/beta hydrolase [Halobacteriales archaeon SW_7_68_16]|nr:MAG: alpha/beta hydrolase [Halobacteriales archaeon SW_7_68_16]